MSKVVLHVYAVSKNRLQQEQERVLCDLKVTTVLWAATWLGLVLCEQAKAQGHNWHDGLHLDRFKPKNIDSKAIIDASAAPATRHSVTERALAAATIPAASEFVSASGTFFQVWLQIFAQRSR